MNRLIEGKNKLVSFFQNIIRSKNNIIIISGALVLLCFFTYLVPLEIDFTRNKANSISKEAKKIVKNLDVKDGEFSVYYFSAIVDSDVDNSVNDRVETVFSQLYKFNKKIHYKIIDLNSNPDALVKYQTAETKCLLIEYKDKSITIPFDEFVYTYDNVLEVDVEQVLIEEFTKLKSNKNYNIYYTTGHGEKIEGEEFSEFKKLISNLGYTLVEANLNDIPAEANSLYIFSPQYDFTKEEIVKLDDYLTNDKSMFITFSGHISKDENDEYDYCPNLVSFCHSLGINVSDKTAVDQIQDTKLIGVYSEYDEDTVKVRELNPIIYMPNSRIITISSIADRFKLIESIISGELTGYPLIIKMTDDNGNKILVSASSDMYNDTYLSRNKIFITYLINWIDNFEFDVHVEPFVYKEYDADATEFKPALILGTIEIMIPLLMLYIGFEISRKRVSSTKSKIMK